ncbi:brain protein I3-like [Mercenaria mercenaria]|uniref:brain protein I3-like n=1 Tax=Mercenaria mercenaria TaxID=6596 RepID=UPI00234F645C|nr:brain protein I3-like [Mercenaria mercenaria]XP_053384679.1 brain protein I3-like [Mercenaria mercenaria]
MSNNQQPPSYQESVGTGGYTNYGAPQGSAPPGPPAGQYDPSKGYPAPSGYHGGYQQLPSYQNQPQVVVQPHQQIIVVGGCPACRVGVLEDDFTCLGVCCAILFFPIGILCCLAMKERRCPNCGAVFG